MGGTINPQQVEMGTTMVVVMVSDGLQKVLLPGFYGDR